MGAKVLVIDDDKNLRALYQQELSDDGYDVQLADSGLAGLSQIAKVRPDIVVLDISMPGMDGIETMNRILAENKSLPVILNTAYSNYKDNFMTWSADAYVVKSPDLTELRAKIKELLAAKSGAATPAKNS